MSAAKPTTAVQLTPQQAAAIQTRDVSVALSAGAGCGKTFVLTRRFLSHLDPEYRHPTSGEIVPPADLSQLVAITFTERAAREMRERIRAETLRRLQQASEEQAPYWLRLWRSLEGARISTFHSFCGTLLRSHAVEAQLDPSFSIIEETTASTLLAEVTDDLLRTLLTERNADALICVTEWGIEGFRDRLLSLWEATRAYDVTCWLTIKPKELLKQWQKQYENEYLPALLLRLRAASEVHELQSFLQSLRSATGAVKDRRDELLALLNQVLTDDDPWPVLETLHDTAKVAGVKKTQFADDEQYAMYRDLCAALRDEIKAIQKAAIHPRTDCLRDAELGLALLRLTPLVEAEYNAAKARENGLDFTDLQLSARKLLTDPNHRELQQRLRQNIRLLLVDECQDTDPVQIEILQALAGDANESNKLFVVGDYKQSIYRFRGADPTVFTALRQATPPSGRLPLSQNFRSQPGVLDFVNLLFDTKLSTETEPYEALQPARKAAGTEPVIEFLWSPGTPGRGSAVDNRATEARWIAQRLRQLIDEQTPLVAKADGTARPLKYGDIAILFKALSDVQLYESALRECGLPYYLVGGRAFYAQQEVYDLLNLLRAIQSPADEIALAGALRSPIFGLTDELLYWLVRQAGSLQQGLFDPQHWPTHWSSETKQQLNRVAKIMAELRRLKDQIAIADLIRRALELTHYDAALLAEFLGERKLANLEKLIDMARVFDRSSTLGLSDFLIQISNFVVNEPRESLAATHPENTDVIKLMTIHKSKGLEFPVVVVPDLERAGQGGHDATAFDPAWGPLVKAVQSEAEQTGLTMYKTIERTATDAEAIRLFYVATTRAADYLILSAAVSDLDKVKGHSLQLLKQRFDLRTGLALEKSALPLVRVTTLEPQSHHTTAHETSFSVQKILKELAETVVAPTNAQVTEQLAPVAPRPMLQRQFAVSRLTATLQPIFSLPDDGTEQPVLNRQAPQSGWEDADLEQATEREDGRHVGLLVHGVLARLTPARARSWSFEQLQEVIMQVAESAGIEQQQSQQRAHQLLKQFHASVRWRLFQDVAELRTEVEFLLPWPAAVTTADKKTARKKPVSEQQPIPYLLGYLDGLFQDQQGGWWIIDYKTNRWPETPAEQKKLVEYYWPQLWVYGLAVEQGLQIAPQGLILHFMESGQEFTTHWTTEIKTKAADWLTAAIRLARQEAATL